ncbi:uncharacterized protein FTJAE_14086 [Fusarium tjaetaba]|uniref:Uncharacterized protein n=1 Tax=Fusarium tjaetaba TaxID=1567544 RepID=A0A8H5Q9S5_9HYPO|nr:uncharacterized protein FTJAE_14086 [Fusarium tjaetaba]KAF5612355.1 hypothetical protein FTJAE_14086 [Fusarium tjaetaba]
MSQFHQAVAMLCNLYTTVFIATELIDRVPHRPSLLLIPFISSEVLRELHFFRVYVTHLLPKRPVPLIIPLTSILILTLSLILCLGFPDREPQQTESQTAHPAAPSMDSQDREENEDHSRDLSNVKMSSDISLENSTGNYLRKLPSHNSLAYTLFKVLERLCNYRMAVVIQCISMVSEILPQDIYLQGRMYQNTYDTYFLVSRSGSVQYVLGGICEVCSYWLELIFVSYAIRWFVLPLLYFLVAVMYTASTDGTVYDRAIAFAHWAEQGTEWSTATVFFGWLKDWMARRNTSSK